jgi:hypothetical protein
MPIKTTPIYDQSPGKSGSVQPIPQAVSASSEATPTLVIGDIHGHLDRLEALLRQEGLLDRCDHCEGSGLIWEPCECYECEFEDKHGTEIDCANCEGDGWARTSEPAEIVLLGDVGHFGQGGSPTGDILTWVAAVRWADVILWGNHDRAVVDYHHAFGGFMQPGPEPRHWFARARREGKLKLAHTSHGYLFTHAGLHHAFKDQRVPSHIKEDVNEFCHWVNQFENPDAFSRNNMPDPNLLGVVQNVGSRRGGRGSGGILWRDISEKLYDRWPQVFGHSADHKEHAVRYCGKTGYTRDYAVAWASRLDPDKPLSYCVDVGGKGDKPGDNCLAGVWLPEGRIVRVDL